MALCIMSKCGGGVGLGRLGGEDDEDGVSLGGGEGGESGGELGIGWFYEGKVEPRVRDGVIGSI